ncbi:hypothetical protein DFR29_12145 [Tahibacter aquaticus]|uniref:DUF2933 family protein n=1 Tax=Tahibacter aquaticus TaxID=520092 RepID=A0A4R6YLZ7_9GAMM|nr:DUF2933 domain-containing protein [Tahibacter aquaticus]TDR38373.1 hypothetical protein DFR29_12145 [Tahibacter aquaticus]
MTHNHSQHGSEPRSFWRSRYSIGLLVFGAIATYFLLSEHRAHFLGALPYLLLLACPLMHVFMHHGHTGHGGEHGHPSGRESGSDTLVAPKPSKTGERS